MKTLRETRDELGRPLVMDGAIGSLLQADKNYTKTEIWSSLFNLSKPELVADIHRAYAAAGAEIITTNTFRTNPVAVKRFDSSIDNASIIKAGVVLAKSVSAENIFIAGSNPPAEDSYQTERTVDKNSLEYNHKYHIEKLYESGVDFILNETQSHFDEIEIICKFCSSNDIPFVVSFFFTGELKLLSGEPLFEAIEYVLDFSPIAVSVNCVNERTFLKLAKSDLFERVSAFYINCGSGDYTDEHISCGLQPDEYVELLRPLNLSDKLFIGTCCGSNPEHTKRIKEFLKNEN